MFCSKCGVKVDDSANFCTNCGAPIYRKPAMQPPMTSAASVAHPNNRIPVVIGADALVVAAVMLFAFVLLPGLHKNPFKGAKVGDIVQFGLYEQDGDDSDGKEPVDWRVLAVDGNRAYVISEKGLDVHAFNSDKSKGNDWDSSDLKAWLEGDFASAAFSGDDWKIIDGAPTLLSVDEANRYFRSDNDRVCYPTRQALDNGIFTWSEKGTCWWRLRTSGNSASGVAIVRCDGSVNTDYDMIVADGAVRPAMWVNL